MIDEIIEITECEELVETVDIHVSGNNLFYANHILTHNCGYNTDNPDLNTISESIGLAATADVIVSIFQNEEDRESNIIKIGMMKNRFGPRGNVCTMLMDYTTLTVTETDTNENTFEESTLESLNNLSMLNN